MTHPRTRVTVIIAFTLLILRIASATSGSPTAARSDPTPTAYPLPTSVFQMLTGGDTHLVKPTPAASLIAETTHYRFAVGSGDFAVDTIPGLATQAEVVYAYVSDRLNASISDPIPVAIMLPTDILDGCPVRGMAMYDEQPAITIFGDSGTSPDYFWGVLSHETAHIIHGSAFGGLGLHVPLSEGLATWAASDYWSRWQNLPSLDEAVRGYAESGEYLSLGEHYDMQLAYNGDDCLYYRDILYTEWASFVGFLIDHYGFDHFLVALTSATQTTTEGSQGDQTETVPLADFEGVYGLTLNQLEAQWLDWIARDSAQMRAVPPIPQPLPPRKRREGEKGRVFFLLPSWGKD
jgi:hypothetical protein